MITITAMKWAPPFAAGQVRDFRVRWVLNEAGWPYEVRLLDAPAMASDQYRRAQPFGQVPALEEDGRPTLFETGAIVLDVAARAGILLPDDPGQRSLVTCWAFAALNSIEPMITNVAEVEYFEGDGDTKAKRLPEVTAVARRRLAELQDALSDRDWLVGETFTAADLLMASVLRIADRLRLLDDHPVLGAYRKRCLDRPAYRSAVADQSRSIADHTRQDMRYDAVGS